jgi:hypothetical protein
VFSLLRVHPHDPWLSHVTWIVLFLLIHLRCHVPLCQHLHSSLPHDIGIFLMIQHIQTFDLRSHNLNSSHTNILNYIHTRPSFKLTYLNLLTITRIVYLVNLKLLKSSKLPNDHYKNQNFEEKLWFASDYMIQQYVFIMFRLIKWYNK